MFPKVVVEAGSEGVTESAHFWIEPTVFRAGQTRNLQRVVAAILLEVLLAVQFRRATKSQDEILFNAPEIVFGLSIGKTENRACVGRAENVRHAIPIAIDSHGPG